jgi:hypothetical protein
MNSLCDVCEQILKPNQTFKFRFIANICLLVESAKQCELCKVMLNSLFASQSLKVWHDKICPECPFGSEPQTCQDIEIWIYSWGRDDLSAIEVSCGTAKSGNDRFQGMPLWWVAEEQLGRLDARVGIASKLFRAFEKKSQMECSDCRVWFNSGFESQLDFSLDQRVF